MTTVLHTADVHLTDDHPERRDALERLLALAEREAVDAVTIGGDLFDRPEDVESLRADLRNDLFADRPFEILLIPGNHDAAAYRGDVFFGDAATVLAADPFAHWRSPDGDLQIETDAYLPLTVDGERVTISGIVDLVHVRTDTVEVVDFKTDLGRHAEAEYRKQLSVYYHVLDEWFPDRTVRASIFYTASGTRVEIDPLSLSALVDLVRQVQRD